VRSLSQMLRAARALSSGHFCGALYKHTGMRPSEYQQRLRISRARELLELSRKSADNIALSIDYEDVGGFRRVFRKIIGLTPSEYRHRFSRLGTTATTLGTDPPNTASLSRRVVDTAGVTIQVTDSRARSLARPS
jgi:hypothetical protein